MAWARLYVPVLDWRPESMPRNRITPPAELADDPYWSWPAQVNALLDGDDLLLVTENDYLLVLFDVRLLPNPHMYGENILRELLRGDLQNEDALAEELRQRGATYILTRESFDTPVLRALHEKHLQQIDAHGGMALFKLNDGAKSASIRSQTRSW
jgi:hypothetical protein